MDAADLSGYRVFGQPPPKKLNPATPSNLPPIPTRTKCSRTTSNCPPTSRRIYSPAFYARTLIEAEVVNGNIQATDAVKENPRTRIVTATEQEHDSYMVTTSNTPRKYSDMRWKT